MLLYHYKNIVIEIINLYHMAVQDIDNEISSLFKDVIAIE